MKLFARLLPTVALLVITATACNKPTPTRSQPVVNSIYHWKTTFELDSAERTFLAKHDIKRIYMRMFDVSTEYNVQQDRYELIPIATTEFKDSIPEGIEIVPITYITLDALRGMDPEENEYAKLIVERLLAMCRHNNCGTIKELHLDCDWTEQTRPIYHRFCHIADSILNTYCIDLGITVRLHQLGETPPPADRGVLMLYNTGNIKDINTVNSILDINDVRPYLDRYDSYPIPLDYAYPAFGWGVRFNDSYFTNITDEPSETTFNNGITIRRERPTADEIITVKQLVEQNLGKPASTNIIYHLDNSQLKHYTDNEITQIYN